MVSGGGAATNAGIDFQNRVGAVVMLAMLTDVGGLTWLLGEDAGHAIELVRFESNEDIDDVVVETDGPRCLVQAKRSLSLSANADSDFSSVIRQFVDQFVRAPDADDRYVIATSASTSRRITTDLRKLTKAARLNELGPDDNPLTKTERQVLETLQDLVAHHFRAQTGRGITEDEQAQLLRRMYVASLDLESGGHVERAVLTVLASRVSTVASLVWTNLIALALALASARLSIDRAALSERFGEHFETSGDAEAKEGDQPFEIDRSVLLPAGREVVLTVLHGQLVLAELRRFAEDGTRRLRFVDGKVEMPNGITSDVLLRAATLTGAARVIRSDLSVVGDRELVIWPINPGGADPEGTSWAQAHAALLAELVRTNPAPLECLVCGRQVSDSSGVAVEIDEDQEPHQVGLVHASCRRPTHRIVGGVSGGLKDPAPELADFDVRGWSDALPRGQGLFGSMGDGVRGRVVHLGWKPGRLHLAVGNWGVTYEDESGTVRYVHERMQLKRFTQREAEEAVQFMTAAIAASAKRNDPICVAEDSEAFGPRSVLLQTDPGRRVHRVTTVAARELSRATIAAHRDADNYYAPLVALQDAETGAVFGLSGAIVLLTDPLHLRDAIENWQGAGIDVPRLTTSVLRSDEQFDGLVSEAFRDGVGVLVDPMLSPAGQLLTGFVIQDFDATMQSGMRGPEAS